MEGACLQTPMQCSHFVPLNLFTLGYLDHAVLTVGTHLAEKGMWAARCLSPFQMASTAWLQPLFSATNKSFMCWIPSKGAFRQTASVVLQQFTSDTVTVQNVLLKAQGHCLFKIPALLNQKSCFYGKNYLVMVTAYFMQVRLVWADCTLWLESPFNFFLRAFASQVPFCS